MEQGMRISALVARRNSGEDVSKRVVTVTVKLWWIKTGFHDAIVSTF